MPRTAPTSATPTATADEPGAQAARVLRQFRQVFNTVKGHFRAIEREAGLAGAQVWALSVILNRPGIGVSALAKALDVRQPTASNLVKALVERGLAEARRDEQDGRAVRLHAKPAGAKLLQRVPGPFVGVLPQALSRLDAGTLQRLEHDLALLLEHLDADPAAGRIPLGQ